MPLIFILLLISLFGFSDAQTQTCQQIDAPHGNICQYCYQQKLDPHSSSSFKLPDYQFVSCSRITQDNVDQLSETQCQMSCCTQVQTPDGPLSIFQSCDVLEAEFIQNQMHFGLIISSFVFCALLVIGINVWRLFCKRRGRVAVHNHNISNAGISSNIIGEFQLEVPKIFGQGQNISDQICCICLEADVNARTSCGHYFHFNCVKQWEKKKGSCPLCCRSMGVITIYCTKCAIKMEKVILKRCKGPRYFSCRKCEK